jgi:histidine triad (HIT) family protein
MDCLFCKIINGDIPSYKIYEDEYVYAFLDINPDSNGHTLVIPKIHTLDLDSIELDTLNNMFKAIKKIKTHLENKLNCDGITLIQNNGDVQEVKHFHIHLKPYYNNKQKLKDVSEMYEILKNCE